MNIKVNNNLSLLNYMLMNKYIHKFDNIIDIKLIYLNNLLNLLCHSIFRHHNILNHINHLPNHHSNLINHYKNVFNTSIKVMSLIIHPIYHLNNQYMINIIKDLHHQPYQ